MHSHLLFLYAWVNWSGLLKCRNRGYALARQGQMNSEEESCSKHLLLQNLFRSSLSLILLHSAIPAYANCDDRFRETAPLSSFRLDARGTAEQIGSGLSWARCSVGQRWQEGRCEAEASGHTFMEAFDQARLANAQTYLGYQDWRLPSAEELQGIVEFQCVNPAINASVFPDTPPSWFWSGSNDKEYPHYGQPVDFSKGNDFIFYKIKYDDDPFPVRLVRTVAQAESQTSQEDSDQDGVNDALEAVQGMNPQLKDNNITRNDRFIMQIYRDLYQREASSSELAQQLQFLSSNPSRVERVIQLALTPEFQQQQLSMAITLAIVINNQIPTPEWLNDWRSELKKGRSTTALIDDYMQKSSLKASYVNANKQDYIKAFGAQLLGRSITEPELQTATIKLQSMTRATFTEYWLNALGIQQIPMAQIVVIQIATVLAQYPLNTDSLKSYSEQLDRGTVTVVDLIQQVFNSAWYANRFMHPIAG